jgi:hypothetical protein
MNKTEPIKLCLIAEFESAINVGDARRQLDAFRESVVPSENYGLTLYEDTSYNKALETLEVLTGRVASELANDLDLLKRHREYQSAKEVLTNAGRGRDLR